LTPPIVAVMSTVACVEPMATAAFIALCAVPRPARRGVPESASGRRAQIGAGWLVAVRSIGMIRPEG
jgi:hypothetical protein